MERDFGGYTGLNYEEELPELSIELWPDPFSEEPAQESGFGKIKFKKKIEKSTINKENKR